MNTTKHTTFENMEAMKRGERAHGNKIPVDDNPYETTDERHAFWTFGWLNQEHPANGPTSVIGK